MKDLKNFELKKAWQWLLYLYLILPLLLFGVAFLTRSLNMGLTFARLWHSYNLYVINPIPHLPSLTGFVGLGIAAFGLLRPLLRKDWKDFGISLVLVAANAAFFVVEANYLLVPFVRFI